MAHKMFKILAADDEPDILDILELLLGAEGFEVVRASTGDQAVAYTDSSIDLCILDVAMPGMDGVGACRKIREKTLAPILFLTAKTQEEDKVAGFAAGGDDYLGKPFSNVELVSRVKALLRRYYEYRPTRGKGQRRYRSGELVVDGEDKVVSVAGKEVVLTPIEYEILELMIRYPKKVFSAQQLYESVWNQEYSYTENNTFVVHISNLRRKIEEDPRNPRYIKSMWGRGYYVE